MQVASLVRRVLARLWQSEVCEPNPNFQADYRIAYIAVLYAARNVRNPAVHASYIVLGLHPSKVWPSIVARRKALLGKEYPLFYDEAGNWKPEPLSDPWAGSSPRKPMGTVRIFPRPPEEDQVA
jgi:hypothetical protein